MKDLGHIRRDISAVASKAVTETINTLAGQDCVGKNVALLPVPSPARSLSARMLLRDPALGLDFRFNFEIALLHFVAARIYPAELANDRAVFEDLAAEIANIVCGKVRASLINQGFDMQMEFPYIEQNDAVNDDNFVVNLYFTCNQEIPALNGGLVVNFQLLEHGLPA